MINSSEIVDSVAVGDVCSDVDRVVAYDIGFGRHQARPFVEDDHGYREVRVDLTEYPAVVTIARRAFELDNLSFEQAKTISAADYFDRE